jgi:hypothetical protein
MTYLQIVTLDNRLASATMREPERSQSDEMSRTVVAGGSADRLRRPSYHFSADRRPMVDDLAEIVVLIDDT